MKIDYSKLISSNGQYKLQSLFHEFRYMTKSEYMPFHLGERERDGYICFYKEYMDSPTEYDAAQKLLGSWKHWEMLCNSPVISPYINKWREEREVRDASRALTKLMEAAEEGNVSAAKFLVETSKKRKAGRPTNDEVEGEKKKLAAYDNRVASIIDRMNKK